MWRFYFFIFLLGAGLSRHTPSLAQTLRWERSFGGTASMGFVNSQPTSDGGYIAVGRLRASQGGDVSDSSRTHNLEDVWVVKYDILGNHQWDRRFSGEFSASPLSVWPTTDGGYLLGCATRTTGQATTNTNDQSEPGRGYYDYWVIKLDSQGHKQWDHRFGSVEDDYLQLAWQAADGSYMLAGTSYATAVSGDKTQAGKGSGDFWIVKLDAQGTKQWDRTLGGINSDLLVTALPTPDGGCLLGGSTTTPGGNGDISEPAFGPGAFNADGWLVKLDAQGTKEWDHRYGGSGSEIITTMCRHINGTYTIAGQTNSGVSGLVTEPGRGSNDCWVVKLTSSGSKIWDHRFGTSAAERPFTILPAAGGGTMLLVATTGGAEGDKSEPGWQSRDYWLLRLSAAGLKLWDRTYGTAGNEDAGSLTRLRNGELLLLGQSSTASLRNFNATGDRTQPMTGMISDGWTIRLDSAGSKIRDMGTYAPVDEVQQAVIRTQDGGLLAAGYGQGDIGYDQSNGINFGLSRYWLLKRDSLGTAQWDTTLFDYDREQYRPLTRELPNGRLLVGGTSRLALPNGGPITAYRYDTDLLAIELDSRGRTLWRQEWGGPGEDWLAELLPLAGSGYALGSTSRSGIGGQKTEATQGRADFWLLRLNSARNRLWDHRFGGSGLDSLVSVRQTADGGYLLAGSTTSPADGDLTEPSRGGADYWLVKVNSLGILQWQHRYGGPGHDWLAAARPTSDGGYLLLGTTTSAVGGDLTEPAHGGRDLWLVKVNNVGAIEWQRRYGGSGQDYAATLELDPDGGFVIGASTSSPASGDITESSRGGTDYWLLRLGSTGGLLWQQRMGGNGEDILTCLTTTRGYGYALGGQSNSPIGSGEHQQASRGGYDYWTLLLGARRVPAPLITSFSPSLGLPGTVVTITGNNFTGTGRVEFNGVAALGFVVNATGTSITVTVPAGASTGLLTVWANGPGSSAMAFVVPADLVISSAQTVQGIYNNITITGPATGGAGVGTLNGPLTVLGSLAVQDGGSLLTTCQPLTGSGSFTLAAGGTLGICTPDGLSVSGATGAVQVSGSRSFSSDATYLYNGTQVQTTGTGLPAQVRNLVVQNSTGLTLSQAVAVAQVLRLTQGNLTTSGHNLTLLSSSAGTALVDNTGGIVLGPATVQRFVAPTRNPGPGYRHFAAPISSATVASLATAGFTPVVNSTYNSSSNPGLVTPFPTVYGYDQSRLSASPAASFAPFDRGWESPAQLSTSLAVGRGYTVHLAASLTVQFTGPLNNGLLPLTLGRATATSALTSETGWHLVGNPYPSPLDWRLLTRPAEIDDACYVFESSGPYTGLYRATVNGFGPAPLIGSGQGFFVRVNTPGAMPTLSFTNAARLTVFGQEPALQRTTADLRPRLRLALAGSTGPADTTIVYFEAGATAGPDARYDADKLANPSGLGLATLVGTRPLAIDGRPLLTAQPLIIPLEVRVPRPGSYTFATAELAHFGPGTNIYLLDTLTGIRQLLVPSSSYVVALGSTSAPGRFALEFRPATPTATASLTSADLMQLYPNPAHATVHVTLPLASTATAVVVLDALGREVLRQSIKGPQLELHLGALARGMYLIRTTGGATAISHRLLLY